MKRSEVFFGLLRIPLDALAVFCALILSYRLRQLNIDLIPRVQLLEEAQTLPQLHEYLETFVYPGIVIFFVVAALLSLYVLRSTRSAWNEVGRIIIAALVWLVAVMAWYFLVRKELFYSRILLVHSAFFIGILVAITRASIVFLQRACLHSGIGVRSVASVGRQKIVPSAQRTLEFDVHYRYLGHYKDVRALKRTHKRRTIDLVLHTDANPKSKSTYELLNYCRSQHIAYALLPPVLAETPHQLRVDHLGLVPLISFQPTPLDGWGRVLKRIGDFVVSLALLILLSPLFLLITLVILLRDGWPILYVSRRIGEFGKTSVSVLKFRTMIKDADKQKKRLWWKSHRRDGPLFKMKNDPRITPTGRFLRRWSLDELPQLLNVLVGEMSLVGPRPHLPEEVKKYDDYQRRVFAIKPGITGLAQISGRSDLPFKEEVRLDLQYIEEWSPRLDLWIMWRTVFTVLKRDGAD